MIDLRNIVLTGPPGSGKSAVGNALSKLLCREFVDMDEEIEKRSGCSIAEYFARNGEDAFRDAESEICLELSTHEELVIAAGGGALLRAKNRLALESSGVLVNLFADAVELLERISQNEDRPLVGGDRMARRRKLLSLLENRRAIYDGIPIQVDTTGLDPVQAAGVVVAVLKQKGMDFER